jgi:hypothetical protein
MTAQKHKVLALFAATVVIFACVPTFTPASAPAPTFDPNSINTVIVQTAGAAATQTALYAPAMTSTPIPSPTYTATETPTETPTATFFFSVPTLTPKPTLITPRSSGLDFECQVISQSPPVNAPIQSGSAFDARWTVVNTGKKAWDINNADYRYVNGEKLHRTAAFDFEKSVASGGTIDFVVPMKAPTASGTYKTTWNINIGKERFCPMIITIVVK